MCPMSSLLNLKTLNLGLRISRIGLRDPGIVVSRAREQADYHQPSGCFGSGVTPKSPWKSLNFQEISRQQPHNIMQIGPKDTQNHGKQILESWGIQLLRKLIFAIPPTPNAWFSNPRHPDADAKIIRKRNLQTSINKYTFLVQGTLKTPKWGHQPCQIAILRIENPRSVCK